MPNTPFQSLLFCSIDAQMAVARFLVDEGRRTRGAEEQRRLRPLVALDRMRTVALLASVAVLRKFGNSFRTRTVGGWKELTPLPSAASFPRELQCDTLQPVGSPRLRRQGEVLVALFR